MVLYHLRGSPKKTALRRYFFSQKQAIVSLSHSATSLVSILEETNYTSEYGTASETTQNRACSIYCPLPPCLPLAPWANRATQKQQPVKNRKIYKELLSSYVVSTLTLSNKQFLINVNFDDFEI